MIIVGGSVYDSNIIVQSNVLYDNDAIDIIGDSSGEGSLSTSGNLLWNQANIFNIGATEFSHGLPAHYQEAMDELDSGNNYMPEGFKVDNTFEGFPALKALYVAGDIYDLRYVQQTNVLGDADYVALEEARLGESQPDLNISTGANALVNIATIYDYDGLGTTTMVGGQVYSDSVLIQADLMVAASDTPDTNALVGEVIAFLDHDVAFELDTDLAPSTVPVDGPSLDVMQSMLA